MPFLNQGITRIRHPQSPWQNVAVLRLLRRRLSPLGPFCRTFRVLIPGWSQRRIRTGGRRLAGRFLRNAVVPHPHTSGSQGGGMRTHRRPFQLALIYINLSNAGGVPSDGVFLVQ